MKYILSLEKESDNIKLLPEVFKKFEGRSLLISFIQESRKLEEVFDVEDFIIYDASDFLLGIADFDKVVTEIDDYMDIVPSTYKKKIEEIDIEAFDFEDLSKYNNIFIILDRQTKYKNQKSEIDLFKGIEKYSNDEEKSEIIYNNILGIEVKTKFFDKIKRIIGIK